MQLTAGVGTAASGVRREADQAVSSSKRLARALVATAAARAGTGARTVVVVLVVERSRGRLRSVGRRVRRRVVGRGGGNELFKPT